MPARDQVVLNDDAVFHFPESDWYWSRFREGGSYESEIDRVLRRAADRPYAFIDAGANFGYWSVLVSSRPYGSHPAVAIEASHDNSTARSTTAARCTRSGTPRTPRRSSGWPP
jgi:hypothetical protein